jgi:rhomboid protease GluP
MLHWGFFHLALNLMMQLTVGSYLNLLYGSPRWLCVYFVSGVFGELASCCFLPSHVGAGSSGAIMGLLTSWLVWIFFTLIRKKFQDKMKWRLLMVVIAPVVIILSISFVPSIDWAAHFGGALQGLLCGIILFTDEISCKDKTKVMVTKLVASIASLGLFASALYYVIVRLPVTSLAKCKENY